MTNSADWLFPYGFFLINNTEKIVDNKLFENWDKVSFNNYYLYVHKPQTYFLCENKSLSALLVGHAYNPFTMEKDETVILQNLLEKYTDKDVFYDYLDEISGAYFLAIFDNCNVVAYSDCAQMYGGYYYSEDGVISFSSHYEIIGEALKLSRNAYVDRIKKSRTWHLYGLYLPGDISPFDGVKRVVPNIEVRVNEKSVELFRFYPRKEYKEASEDEYPEIVKKSGEILNNSMVLISQKWKNPAVSLTGGTDSKTTLASAYGVQDKFKYFSYVSLPRELTDAIAAKDICKALGLEHKIFNIDTDNKDTDEFSEMKDIIVRNYGYIGFPNNNDVSKRIALSKLFDYDIEVKSWVSEIARASRYVKYRKNKFKNKITPRELTSMYKIFLFNRIDAVKTDKIFKDYITNTDMDNKIIKNKYPWTEFFVWETVFGSWGSLALTCEHMTSFNITVPYNNRALIDLMLHAPLYKRKNDALHNDIIKLCDKRIDDLNIVVVNGNETDFRALCERLYYDINSNICF